MTENEPLQELPWEKAYLLPDCGPARLVPENEARELWEMKDRHQIALNASALFMEQRNEYFDKSENLTAENEKLRGQKTLLTKALGDLQEAVKQNLEALKK